MKYRKKPIIIEAFQFRGGFNAPLKPIWFQEGIYAGSIIGIEGNVVKIPCKEGEVIANVGDYIIKGIKGEIYACKEDVFLATYEKVENE